MAEQEVDVVFKEYILGPYLASCSRVIDMGCQEVVFLSLLPDNGACGVDIDEAALRVCRTKGLRVAKVNLDCALPFAHETFGAVILSHVLEHLVAPLRTLQEINRILKAEGWLLLALPVEGSLVDKLGRNKYFKHHPGHIYSFTPQNIKILLDRSGFWLKKLYIHPWPAGKLKKLGILKLVLPLYQLLPADFMLALSDWYWIVAQKPKVA